MSEINCNRTTDLVCPYCGHKFLDSWELVEENGDQRLINCRSCEKEFTYTTHIKTSFTSRKIEDK